MSLKTSHFVTGLLVKPDDPLIIPVPFPKLPAFIVRNPFCSVAVNRFCTTFRRRKRRNIDLMPQPKKQFVLAGMNAFSQCCYVAN
jgi:hypothetical protein